MESQGGMMSQAAISSDRIKADRLEPPRAGIAPLDYCDEGLHQENYGTELRDYISNLEALASENMTSPGGIYAKQPKAIDRFHSMVALKAAEVDLTIDSSGETLIVRARGKMKRFHYSSIGFGDARTSNSFGILWLFLKRLAGYGGEVSFQSKIEGAIRKNMKKHVQLLRALLRHITGIEDEPFHRYDRKRHIYALAFKGIKDLGTDMYEYPVDRFE
jgi:hypothetical protein